MVILPFLTVFVPLLVTLPGSDTGGVDLVGASASAVPPVRRPLASTAAPVARILRMRPPFRPWLPEHTNRPAGRIAQPFHATTPGQGTSQAMTRPHRWSSRARPSSSTALDLSLGEPLDGIPKRGARGKALRGR